MQELTTEETAVAVREAIDKVEPFSLIRLGDGEAIILGYPEFYSPERLLHQLRRWFGEHAKEPKQFTALRPLLESAIRDADILGTHFAEVDAEKARAWLLRPCDVTQQEKEFTAQMSYGLLPHLTKPLLSHQKICSKVVHLTLLTGGFLNNLLMNLQRVTVITCNDVSEVLHSINSTLRLRHIHVPGQAIREGDRLAEWQRFDPHFPVVCDRVLNQVKGGDYDSPVLVGAGPLGKVYCDEVKRSGGVGIDIGSVLDVWAGRITRAYMETDRFRAKMRALAAQSRLWASGSPLRPKSQDT